MRDNELGAAFADVWRATLKVVLSRTLDSVRGNARLAEASVVEEAAAALDATDKDFLIGGAGLAGAAIEVGLVEELRGSQADRHQRGGATLSASPERRAGYLAGPFSQVAQRVRSLRCLTF